MWESLWAFPGRCPPDKPYPLTALEYCPGKTRTTSEVLQPEMKVKKEVGSEA